MNKIYTGAGIIDPKVLEEKIKKNENIVVVDSTEIYLKTYYKTLKEKGYNIKILNFKDNEQSDLFNVLDYPYYLYKNKKKSNAIDLINGIANIITYNDDEKSDPFWSISAANLISGTIIALFDDAKKEEINLKSVHKLLNKVNEPFNNKDKLTEYFKLKDDNDQAKMHANPILSYPKDTRLSVVAVANVKTSIYLRDFNNVPLGKSNIKLKDFEREKQALFIINNAKSDSAIISILINELLYSRVFNNPKCNILISNLNALDFINNLDEFLQTSEHNNVTLFVNIGSKKLFSEKYKEDSLDNLELGKTVEIKNIDENIDYPRYKKIDAKNYFDLDEYFHDHNIVNDVKVDIDDLLNKIDYQINELEKMEKNSKD